MFGIRKIFCAITVDLLDIYIFAVYNTDII